MESKVPGSGLAKNNHIDWSKASELVESGEYERVALVLKEAQLAAGSSGNESGSKILGAAHEICQACEQLRRSHSWHLQVSHDAKQQELESRRRLQALLVFIGGQTGKKRGVEEHRGDPSVGPPFASPAAVADTMMAEQSEGDLESAMAEAATNATLLVFCLGRFRVFQHDRAVEKWISNKGRSVFQYLVANRTRPVAKEVLMDLFWADAEPQAARNNLNVAIYGLRRSFHGDQTFILFQDDRYFIDPDVRVWVDTEQFLFHAEEGGQFEERGRLNSALAEYRKAVALYQGEYLEEDRYDDWLLPYRRQLHQTLIHVLDRMAIHLFAQKDYDSCAVVCNKVIAVDACHEIAHRRLMQCYSRQGQQYLAIRQYHHCVEALANDLDIGPSQPTEDLHDRIQRGLSI